MKNDELIGLVGAAYLRERLSEGDDGSTARYLLDCLTAEQTAAIAKTVSSDSQLAGLTEIKLPAHFVGHLGLPDEFLTNERTTYYRNAACDKSVLLVANTGDDEEQSLKELEPIGCPQLFEDPGDWVRTASVGLPLMDEHKKWWTRALLGLLDVKHFSLERFAGYVLATRSAIENGHPILAALGVALPELQIPLDTAYFKNVNNKTAGHRSKWRKLYNNAFTRRACYLLKETPNQGLLTEETLRDTFERVSDMIPGDLHECVNAFIDAPGGWNSAAEALAQCEWDSIRRIFEDVKKDKFNLGTATLGFYDEREENLLTDDECDYLKRLENHRPKEAQDEDDDFYHSHRSELKEDPSLKTKWDQFVYGKPVEADDLLVGLAICLGKFFDRNLPNGKRILKIRCDKKTKGELKQLNYEAGRFFAFRYKGLDTLFGSKVVWEVGKLFQFDSLYEEWRSTGTRLYRSVAKAALRLKFYMELVVEHPSGQTETHTTQLMWTFKPNAVPAELPGDWERLCEHPLVRCVANLEPVSSKGHYQSIDLLDAKTLLPTYDTDRGSFVGGYKRESDIGHFWPERLSISLSQSLIDQEAADNLGKLFEKFKNSYHAAIRNFKSEGIACKSLLEQAHDYHVLLDAVCNRARGDRNRELLLRPLLEIGAVRVEGGHVTTIAAPWHPLRLAAVANKARQVASLLKQLLAAEEIFLGDTRLYFKELKNELAHPYYPEIVLGWDKKEPKLLTLTDSYLDYSLHEPPVANDTGFDDTNENPTRSTNIVLNTLKSFLSLYPHEKANLSMVLYNSDSSRLPRAIVDKVSELQDDEDDMRCQIVLRHRNNRKLSSIYEKIVEAADSDPDSFVASEAAKDFMARLRIGIMADQAPIPDPKDGPPFDIVFLQDVIARKAKLEWYPVDAAPMDSSTFVPSRWSRRRPSAFDDMKSVVFLCSPVQTRENWSFINALTSFLKAAWDGDPNKKLLPARQLDFNDTETASIFKEIHHLGNWVVNYDELLERRQLLNQDVRVIRYKQLATQGRNILISSTAPLGLLQTMVQERFKLLNIKLTDEECKELANRFMKDASDISGEIVLRAAKRGRNASELMGIVLSRFLIQQELGTGSYFGWYFLDDYAEWLGQREEQIADILALVPHTSVGGKMRLAVVVCESKFISAENLSSKRKESQKQLRDTMRRINDAIFGDPRRLDRALWLSRFSDLVLTGIRVPAGASIDLEKWRRAIRSGNCEIYLRGYSHIFVYKPAENSDCSEFAAVAEDENSYQEIFSRSMVRKLVEYYRQGIDPMPVRIENSGTDVWGNIVYKPTTEQLNVAGGTVESANTEVAGRDGNAGKSRLAIQEQETESALTTKVMSDVDKGEEAAEQTPSVWAYPCVGEIIARHHAVNSDSAEDKEWLRETENACKGALQQFQLRSKLLHSILTPNSALLKFKGSSNLTVEQVLRRRSEFLTTHRLPIISVRGEPGMVAISIARPNRRVLHLLDVWKGWKPNCINGNHSLLVGLREEDSSLLLVSPKDNSPHTLIAGATGSGKSVLMQNIILAIACTTTAEQSCITLIDPKSGVDYFPFEGLPHLKNGVIDDQKMAISVLKELVSEMDKRYEMLRKNRVSNIYDLNNKADATTHLPYLWIVHDEFAEWMMSPGYAENVANVVARLGVKARAAGIFLVFAAQRPDRDVMPMQLRSNLGNRLILRVDSEGTSEIALGEKGAERLLGKGHVAVKLEGEEGIITAQVPFITTDEIETIVSELSKNGKNRDEA